METRSYPTVQAFLPPPDTRLIFPPPFSSRLFAFFLFVFFAFSCITICYSRQGAFALSRPSTNDPRSRIHSAPTQILGVYAEGDRFPLNLLVEYGRWRHDRFCGRTMVQRCVVNMLPFVQPKLLGEKRTLVLRRRITAYRLRRNRGRIKLCSKRKKAERKISEKVGLVLVHCSNRDGDKMIPSTSVTISRAYGSLLSSLRSARSVLYFLIDDRDAAGDQSARRVE